MSPSASSVAVVRALPGLGDLLCALPALRALRSALPDARLTLIGLPDTAALLGRFPGLVDDLAPFPGYPGIPEVPFEREALDAFIAERSGSFAKVFQMHGNGRVMNRFVEDLRPAEVAGYRLPCAPAREGLEPYGPGRSEARRWTRLVERATGEAADTAVGFPVRAEERRAAEALLAAMGVRRPYACLHPGASDPRRMWRAAGFARVAEELRRRGIAPLLTGTAAERAACSEVALRCGEAPTDASGATGTGELAALLAGAALVVCNDTGVSHLAAALSTPSVVVFTGATDPARWAPEDRRLHRVVEPGSPAAAGDVPTAACAFPEACGGAPCPVIADRPRRGRDVSDADVLAAVRGALSEPEAARRAHVA